MSKFKVEVNANAKNCFVSLPKNFIKDKFITKATIKMTWMDYETSEYCLSFVGWSWDFHSQKDVIILPILLANNLNLVEGSEVNLQILHKEQFSKKIFVEPLSLEDSEILEQNQINIELSLRNQIFVLYKGLIFPFYVNEGTSINIQVLEIEQEKGEKLDDNFAILNEETELIVKTKSNDAHKNENFVELKVLPNHQEDAIRNHFVLMKKENILNAKSGDFIKLNEFIYKIELSEDKDFKKNEIKVNRNMMKELEMNSFETIKGSLYNDKLSQITQIDVCLIDFEVMNLFELKQLLRGWLNNQKSNSLPISSKNLISIEFENENKNLIMTVPGNLCQFYEFNEKSIDKINMIDESKLMTKFKSKDSLDIEFVPIFEKTIEKALKILNPFNLFSSNNSKHNLMSNSFQQLKIKLLDLLDVEKLSFLKF
jgi:hypothetical protein